MGIFSADMPTPNATPLLSDTNPSAGAGDPATMGGTPAVMTSNDWWKNTTDFAASALNSVAKIQASRNQTGIAAPAGVLSSTPQNPAPGSRGLNFQAASTPGANAVGANLSGMSTGMVIVAGLAVIAVLVYLARR